MLYCVYWTSKWNVSEGRAAPAALSLRIATLCTTQTCEARSIHDVPLLWSDPVADTASARPETFHIFDVVTGQARDHPSEFRSRVADDLRVICRSPGSSRPFKDCRADVTAAVRWTRPAGPRQGGGGDRGGVRRQHLLRAR